MRKLLSAQKRKDLKFQKMGKQNLEAVERKTKKNAKKFKARRN